MRLLFVAFAIDLVSIEDIRMARPPGRPNHVYR